MRRLFILALLVTLSLPAAALAQEERKGEFAANFTWAHANFEDVFTYRPAGLMVEGTGFINEWFGITGEFGWGTGSGEISFLGLPVPVAIDTMSYMGGVRFRFANDSRVTPSVRVVAGGLNAKATVGVDPEVNSQTGFSMAFGGAVDIGISDRVAVRIQPDFLTFWIEGANDTMFRFAFGVVYGF